MITLLTFHYFSEIEIFLIEIQIFHIDAGHFYLRFKFFN